MTGLLPMKIGGEGTDYEKEPSFKTKSLNGKCARELFVKVAQIGKYF